MFYHLEETTSTNDVARDEKYRHGDLIRAERQTAGRGQRGHAWSSREGDNLLFTLVLEPTFLSASEQFLVSEAVALALTDTFAAYGLDAQIKWTNDIYIGDRKAVGILIEHNLSGPYLRRTIVGIGVNVNQTEFDPALPNPTSMRLAAGRTFDRYEVLDRLYAHLMRRYGELGRGAYEELQADYRQRMYRLGERHRFRFPDGHTEEGIVRGVRASGELLVEHDDGHVGAYLFRQIEFVVAARGD